MTQNYVKKTLSKHFLSECNANVARLSALFSHAKAPFELAYFQLHPQQATIEHAHNEQEIFICIDGKSAIKLNQHEYVELLPNEIIFVEKGVTHQIINNTQQTITILAVWWHEPMVNNA